jgi:cytochrome c5
MRTAIAALLALTATAAGAAEPADTGRRIFAQVCSACHVNDLSEAPQVKQPEMWAPRIAKGRETLYRSALEGFVGPTGEEMPPRGAQPDLTDDEVRAAVDYILSITMQKGTSP